MTFDGEPPWIPFESPLGLTSSPESLSSLFARALVLLELVGRGGDGGDVLGCGSGANVRRDAPRTIEEKLFADLGGAMYPLRLSCTLSSEGGETGVKLGGMASRGG